MRRLSFSARCHCFTVFRGANWQRLPLFILLNGEVDVRQNARVVQTLVRGQFFGEIGLLANVMRTATVTTGTPVDVLRIAGGDFRNLLRESPTLALAVLEELAYRLQTTALAG